MWGRATKKNPERLSARGFARSEALGLWSAGVGVGGWGSRSAGPLKIRISLAAKAAVDLREALQMKTTKANQIPPNQKPLTP